jgi:hypothetical protein
MESNSGSFQDHEPDNIGILYTCLKPVENQRQDWYKTCK